MDLLASGTEGDEPIFHLGGPDYVTSYYQHTPLSLRTRCNRSVTSSRELRQRARFVFALHLSPGYLKRYLGTTISTLILTTCPPPPAVVLRNSPHQLLDSSWGHNEIITGTLSPTRTVQHPVYWIETDTMGEDRNVPITSSNHHDPLCTYTPSKSTVPDTNHYRSSSNFINSLLL